MFDRYDIGEGRLLKAADLDKLYAKDADGVRRKQGDTGATLTPHTDGSNGGFVNKLSAKRKRTQDQTDDARRQEKRARRAARLEAIRAQPEAIAQALAPLRCAASPPCDKRFRTAWKCREHVCSAVPPPVAPSPPLPEQEALWTGNEGCSAEALEPAPPLGHGLVLYRRALGW